MAQLVSPVCTDLLLKFRSASPPPFLCSGSRRRCLVDAERSTAGRRRGRSYRSRKRMDFRVAAAVSQDDVVDDYYAVLGLLPDATPQQIKKAYYDCMKACHPDLSGNDPEITNFCMFINEVYAVLSDPVQRTIYDEIHGYAATAINPFLDESAPKDYVFVDEFSCIGCKNCANTCPGVFKIEEDFGRARVCNQIGDPDLIGQAIETCPVDCIHRTSAAQLSLLEDEMRRVERVNVGLMMAGMGVSTDVFRMASRRWEKRQAKVLEKVRMRMVNNEGSDKSGSWTDFWGQPKKYQPTEEDAKERAKRAAEAARRWREYSRRGADRSPTFKLPETIPSKD